MQLCHSFIRITRLLSAPYHLRIGDWLCVLPAITLVVWQVPEHLNTKLLPRTAWWWTAKPTGWNAATSLPSWWGEGPLYTEYLWHESVLCIQCCVKAANTISDIFGIHWNLYSVSSTPSTLYSFDLFVQYLHMYLIAIYLVVGVKLVNYPHVYYFSHFTHFTLYLRKCEK